MNNNIFELGKFCADKADPLLDTSFDIGPLSALADVYDYPLSDSATVDQYVKNLFKIYRYKYKKLRDFSYKIHSDNNLYKLSL